MSKEEVEPMEDGNVYCAHRESVDGHCKKCDIYLCKKCQVESHFDHIQEIRGLDSLFTEAIKEYTLMIATLDKHLATSNPTTQSRAVEETLQHVERKIAEEYDKLLKDIGGLEEEQIATLRNSPFLAKLQKEKEELEGEELQKLTSFDKKLATTIAQLLGALIEDKYDNVMQLLAEKTKDQFVREAQLFDPYYEKQRKFLKHLEVLKSVKPKITYDPQLVESLVQVRGVHDDLVTLLSYDPRAGTLLTCFPKATTAIREEVPDLRQPRKCAQVVLEEQSLLVVGGLRDGLPINAVLQYTEVDRKVISRAPMKEERASHSLVNRKDAEVYAVGGLGTQGLLSTAEVFDCRSNVWKSLPSMAEPRKNLTLCLCADKWLYAIGGWNGKEIAVIEAFNIIEAKGWEVRKVHGAVTAQKAGAVAINDTQIVIFGGKAGGQKRDNAAIYDTNRNSISPKAPLTTADCFRRSDARVFEGTIYVNGNIRIATHVYHIKSNKWSLLSEKDYTLKHTWD